MIAICIMAIFVYKQSNQFSSTSEDHLAGKKGERIAAAMITKVLREDDYLFTNVEVRFDGKSTELDSVVVNKYGLFIFEVKNYVGKLIGDEDDYEWTKIKISPGGNRYETQVKNPLRQLKRQIYILSSFLRCGGVNAWVQDYAIFLHNNCPFYSDKVITNVNDIDKIIHSYAKRGLNTKQIEIIVDQLEKL